MRLTDGGAALSSRYTEEAMVRNFVQLYGELVGT